MKKTARNHFRKVLVFFVLPVFLFQAVFVLSSCKITDGFLKQINKSGVTSDTSIAAGNTGYDNSKEEDNGKKPGHESTSENLNGSQNNIYGLQKDIYLLMQNQSAAVLESEPGYINDAGCLPVYEIELEIDFENGTYEGRQNVYYTNLEDTALDNMYFRLFPNSGNAYGNGSLEVSKDIYISADTEKSGRIKIHASTIPDGSVLEVLLPEPLLPGQSILTELEFSGRVPKDFSEGSYGFFNKTENTICLAGWFPILAVFDSQGWNLDPSSRIGDSVYSDMSFFNVNICTDSDLEIISTGVLANSRQLAGQSKTVYSFISGPVRDFIIIAGADYNISSSVYNGIKFNCHYLNNRNSEAAKSLETAKEAFEIFEEKFGRYPYREFDIVEVPLKNVQGIEFPQLILINSKVFGDENVIVHEAAHQWWYNLVGNDPIDNPWMDEALATYCQVLFAEETKGADYAQGMLVYFENQYKNNASSGQDIKVGESLGYFEPKGSKQYTLTVYYKGALFLNEVRKNIGDEAFFTALKLYYELKKYKIAEPQDMLSAFEKASGEDLSGLYDEWVYSSKN